jgi:hypothetical protein
MNDCGDHSAGLTSQHWRRLTEDAAVWRALHAKTFGGPPVPATRLKMVRSVYEHRQQLQPLRVACCVLRE